MLAETWRACSSGSGPRETIHAVMAPMVTTNANAIVRMRRRLLILIPSWPGLPAFAKASADRHSKARRSLGVDGFRPSTSSFSAAQVVDARVKPGHDEERVWSAASLILPDAP